jgi:hypothetical protein
MSDLLVALVRTCSIMLDGSKLDERVSKLCAAIWKGAASFNVLNRVRQRAESAPCPSGIQSPGD